MGLCTLRVFLRGKGVRKEDGGEGGRRTGSGVRREGSCGD